MDVAGLPGGLILDGMADTPTGCPSSTKAGCRCWEQAPGLAAHAPDPIAYERMLARIRPAPTVAVRPGEAVCTGELTCTCPRCERDREQRMVLARARRNVRQPWQPRAA